MYVITMYVIFETGRRIVKLVFMIGIDIRNEIARR